MVNLPGPIASAYEKHVHDENVEPAVDTNEVDENERIEVPEPEVIPVADPDPDAGKEQQPDPSEDYKKRYSSYKAHADQTIHELRTMVTSQSTELATLRYQMEQIISQNKELKESVPKDYIPKGVLSDEDLESLGPENAQRIARIAEARAKAENAELRMQVEHVAKTMQAREQAAADSQREAAENDFWSRVQAKVKEAPQIDEDPKFAEFLNTVDSESGKTWRQLGDDAKRSGNVRAMALIFQEFQQASAGADRRAEVTPRGAQAGAQAPTGTQGKKIWTQKEYEASVYKLLKGGQMTPEKTAKIEALQVEFNRALRENRVRG